VFYVQTLIITPDVWPIAASRKQQVGMACGVQDGIGLQAFIGMTAETIAKFEPFWPIVVRI